MIAEHAVGIRSYGQANIRDTFALPRCAATALHGIAEGAWEFAPLASDAPVPDGWQRVSPDLMRRTIWERIS